MLISDCSSDVCSSDLLVLLEQEFDAAGELLDRIRALAVHRVEIEFGRHLDAELGHRAAGRSLEIFGRVEHRLRRDAADIEAGAAQRLAAFRARHLEAQLRGADRGDVAARPGTAHQDVLVGLPIGRAAWWETVCHSLSISGGAVYIK